MRIGEHNAITDVDGIQVGQHTRDEAGWLTGVSVIVPPPGTNAGVDVRGGGPGTRETDVLDPRNLVDSIDAVVLSGGSAFGLSTTDGVMRGIYDDGGGWPTGLGLPEQRVPIVPTAILFDLGRAGSWLHHPDAADGAAAYAARSGGPVAQGCVGAGTGASTGGIKGGIGTASAVLESGHTLGAIVAVNAVGSAIGLDGRLLGAGYGLGDEFGELPTPDPDRVTAHWEQRAAELQELQDKQAELAGMATTIGVIATDAALTKGECAKLAGLAHDGFARALNPVHTAFDGDTVFTLATGARPVNGHFELLELQIAAADVMTRAIVHALLNATGVDRSADEGLLAPSWRDLCEPAASSSEPSTPTAPSSEPSTPTAPSSEPSTPTAPSSKSSNDGEGG